MGALLSIGSTQIGEQKAPQVQANVLAAVPLLKRLFGGRQGNKGAATKPTEPTPQPEWFNAMAAGMKFTIYDENGTAQYSQTVDVGTVPPENWGKLMQTYTAPMSGLLEVEIFNYNINFPVYFDDWHITLTENPKPEVKSPQPQRGVDEITSKTPPSGAGGLSDGLLLFNGKELQTYADLHLYDYHWRHWDASRYDPQLGRWHSPDPADQFHGLSGYAYCANNPVMLTDPDGRIIPFVVGAIIVGALAGGTANVINNWDNIQKNGFWTGVGYFAVGAAAGAAGTAIGIATAGAGTGIGFALAASIGATTTGVVSAGVIGGVLNYGFDVATFGAHNVDGWQSFFRGATAGMTGATAGMGFFKGGFKGMVDAFFGKEDSYKNYTPDSWAAKNLDTPLGNAVKDGILSIAEARASGDYKPDKWFETMITGFGTSLISGFYEEVYKSSFPKRVKADLLNPMQKFTIDYFSAYTAQVVFEQNFNILSPAQGVITDYFLSDGLFQYVGWSQNSSFYTRKQPSLFGGKR